MEHPPNLPPIPNIEPNSPLFLGFSEPPPRPPFMASAGPNDGHSVGQNYNRDDNLDPLPPPPPTNQAQNQMPPQDGGGAVEQVDQQRTQERDGPSDDSGEGSGSDREDSEEEDERQLYLSRWRPIEEDKSEPCQDELDYISSREENSALDHDYWERETFFDVDDPQIVPGESGRIDWLVEGFNGTEDKPNKEHVMRSSTVRIGDYDWRIKFYPKGNNSEYLSVYLECVTMQAAEFEESEEFKTPPLPFLAGEEKLMKRRSAAVQLSVVMYNPAEPRVHEFQIDAHQFTKKASDYGWTRFTRHSRRDFYYRNHGQRRAILRDDKLAFKAFIRVVHDPTNCLWSHGIEPYEDSLALTGLRPFASLTPSFAAQIPLLHFAPFRDFLYRCRDTKIVYWFQNLLWKMMCRRRSVYYGHPGASLQIDPIAYLTYCARLLVDETDLSTVIGLIGSFNPKDGAVGPSRLKTKNTRSLQEAIDAHQTPLATPMLLTVELERHEFDRKARKWKKLTNKVEVPNKITVASASYQLFSFSTHCGDLTSNKFNIYVRPNGTEAKLWYKYMHGSVACLTHKQAVDKHLGSSGTSEPINQKGRASRVDLSMRGQHYFENQDEVVHVVMYMRDDCVHVNGASPIEETWAVPENVPLGEPPKEVLDLPEPPPTATEANIAIPEPETDEDRARKKSYDETAGFATPNAWPMDGEDVIMNDASDDDSTLASNEDLAISRAGAENHVGTRYVDYLGHAYYNGNMFRHIYHGTGHLIAMNGDEYTGDFREGEKQGYGKMVYGDTGNIYEGEWAHGEHHGQGKLTEAATGNIFEGGWKEGRKHGEFVLTGTVTEEDKGCCSICYDKEINTAFYDCGHVLACRDCANMIQDCPICRKRVLARLQLYGVKMSFD